MKVIFKNREKNDLINNQVFKIFFFISFLLLFLFLFLKQAFQARTLLSGHEQKKETGAKKNSFHFHYVPKIMLTHNSFLNARNSLV